MANRTKIKHLKIMYKRYIDSLASSGAGRRKSLTFFDELDKFLGDKPDATGIENSIDISDSISEISNEIDDEVGKLLKNDCMIFFSVNYFVPRLLFYHVFH